MLAAVALETAVDREAGKPCRHALPERERTILYLRFFRDMTQTRIGETRYLTNARLQTEQPML